MIFLYSESQSILSDTAIGDRRCGGGSGSGGSGSGGGNGSGGEAVPTAEAAAAATTAAAPESPAVPGPLLAAEQAPGAACQRIVPAKICRRFLLNEWSKDRFNNERR
jgi:hypothetical protein